VGEVPTDGTSYQAFSPAFERLETISLAAPAVAGASVTCGTGNGSALLLADAAMEAEGSARRTT
jgi:hypothetical protein